MKTTRNIGLWVLYDFANSLLSITFFLYFAQWIVVEQGISDFRFNLTFTLSAILLLCTVPVTGALLDRSWRRITGLRYTTLLTAVFYSICAWTALNNYPHLSLIAFTLGIYIYLLSFTFYTPLLNDIASKKRRGLVSGLGIGANYLGQITGILVALIFATGKLNLFGGTPRVETLFPAIALFFIFSLPMLIFFKEPHKKTESHSLSKSIKHSIKETKWLFASKSAVYFLIAYFLFNDTVMTASNNFPIFLEQVWHVSDTIKSYLLLGILITSAIGGMVSGLFADKYGHKRTLLVLLAGWVVILPTLGLLTNFTLLVIATTLMGFWFGASWTVSRSVMSYVAPKGKHNLSFGFFGLAERASALIGPLVWGGVVTGLASFGSVRYRIATVVITLFVFLGMLVLRKVKSDRK